MKALCNRAAMFEAVQLASSIVPARTPKPILRCAKIEADREEKKITVTATDNEITIKYVIPQVQVDQSGIAVVPADRITAILRETLDETISLELSDSTLNIIGKDARFRIYGDDPEDFPAMLIPQCEGTFVVNAAELKTMVHMTAFAAARESTRYAINGVLWEIKGKKTRLVATDGRRLALADGHITGADVETEKTAIIPVKMMQIIERMLHDPEEKIQVCFTDNHVLLTSALVEISGNQVQGRFPKYDDVIPKDNDKKLQIAVDDFQSAVRRVALLTNEQTKGILMSLSQDRLCLSSSTPEAGDAEVTLPVEYRGEEIEIGFNPGYLLDMLRALHEQADEIVCELSTPQKPGLIRVTKNFLYVLMPVTIK